MSRTNNLAQNKNKIKLKKIDWSVVRKIITFLRYNGKTKKTNIAMICNMSYDKCARYLEWLRMMDLIKNETDENGFELLSLNDRGIDLCIKEFTTISI